VTSVGSAINERGQIIGISASAEGNLRACLWQDGVMYDLNNLVIGGSHLHLVFPTGINNSGEISGFGVTATGEMHAFLANPVNGNGGRANVPAEASDAVRARVPITVPEHLRPFLERAVGRTPGIPRLR
jgi:probable HAF family extracellular repeat protein